MSVDPRIAAWTGRIDGKVKAEVIRMHHHKSAWDRVSAMLSDNADLPHSYWWEFMFETYAITQASAVRRQADNRKDVDSLMRFIMDVRKGAAALTRTWWVDTLWSPSHPIERYEAERQWREHFGGFGALVPCLLFLPSLPRQSACEHRGLSPRHDARMVSCRPRFGRRQRPRTGHAVDRASTRVP